jgi:hypothetical protein
MKRRDNRVGQVRPEQAPTVTAREFVRIWQTASSVAEVAKKVGRSKNACRVRAHRYREYWDVPLKYFPVIEVEPIDWDELGEFARSLMAESEGPTEPQDFHPFGPVDAD